MANSIKAKDVIKGMFSSYAPVTFNSIDSARQVASDVKTIGRKINTGMRQNMTQIDKSQPGRRAIALFNAARDALRDGTYEIEQANEDMYDDYEDYDKNFTTDNMTEEERANTSPEEVILRGNRGIAQSVIRSSTAQLSGMSAMSNKILKGTLKGMEASTKSINTTIMYSTNILSTQLGTANSKLDTINANLVNLINYQNENTTKYYEKNLELMNNMIASMTNLTAMTQGKGSRDLKNFNTRNGFNFKDYISRVKKGIKNSAAFTSVGMLGSMYQMASQNPEIMSIGETYGQMIPTILSIFTGKSKLNKGLTTFGKMDKRFGQYLNEGLTRIGDKISGNLFASFFGLDSLGNKRRNIGSIHLSSYMKDQLPWNGKAQKALTEVIPELLTSIDAGINKTDKRYFDYDEGYWKSRQELDKDFANQISNSISLEFNSLMDKLSKKFEMSGKSAEDISSAKTRLSNIINDRIYNRGDIQSARQEMSDTLESMNLSVNEFNSAFGNIESAISQVTETISEFYSRIGSSDSVYRNINNRSGVSASQAIGIEAFKTTNMNRRSTNIFGMTFSQDTKSIMQFIENDMKSQYPDFKMTKEYQDGILAAIRSGKSDFEILRMVKNTYAKSSMLNKGMERIKKFYAKIRRKEYQPSQPSFDSDDADDFGTRGNAIDHTLLQAAYGIKTSRYEGADYYVEQLGYDAKEAIKNAKRNRQNKRMRRAYTRQFKRDFNSDGDLVGSRTVQPRKNAAGAASSRGSRDSGKTAGAGTTGASQATSEGKSFDQEIDRTTERTKDSLIDAATESFDNAMNSNENQLRREERLRDQGAEVVTNMGKQGGRTFSDSLKNMLDATVVSMGSMISSFTSFGARLFGKDGLIHRFFESDAFKSTIKKVKDKLFNEKDGIFKDQVIAIKKWGKEVWGKTKENLAKGYDWVYDKYATYKYGEDYENNEKWQNSSLMQTLNLKAKREAKKAKEMESANTTENTQIDNITLTTSTGKTIRKNASGRWIDERGKFVPKSVVDEAKKFSESTAKIDTNPISRDIVGTKSNSSNHSDSSKVSNGKSSIQEVIKSEIEKTSELSLEITDTVEQTKSSVEELSSEIPEVLKESTQKIADAGGEAAKSIENNINDFNNTFIGDANQKTEVTKKKYARTFNETIKKYLPKIGAGAIVGAGVGLLNGIGGASILGSLFLPTGIIGGAIVGGGLTLLSQTEAFKSMLFGKKGTDGERSGGLISKELKEKFKKAAPIAVGGAVAGALKSVIFSPITGGKGLGLLGVQLLPGGILGGAILGMGVGLLKNSETFKSMLFGKKGDDGKRTGTWLSKSYEAMKEKMEGTGPYIKNALKGAGIGAVSGAVLANMGAIPAAFSLGGPIGMGVFGLGMGIAASTKRFNELMFGVEEFDDNGNSLGRKGGILGRVKNLININVVQPIADSFKSAMADMIDWTKDKITLPFRAAFGPIIDSIRGIKDNVVEYVKDKFEAIGNGTTSMIRKTLHTLFSPITKLIGGVGKAMIGATKIGVKATFMPLTMGLGAMQFLTSGKRIKEYGKFYKAYYTQGGLMKNLREYWDAKNQDYEDEAAAYNEDAIKNNKPTKKARRVGMLDKVSDFMSAITGNGEIANHAREAYNDEHSLEGKNSLNWRSVFREKRDLRKNRRDRHDAERQWKNINKLSRKIGNDDLQGREVVLTDAMFKRYKNAFVKKGIDANLINTNDDLMELIYHPDKFRKRAAGDSEQNGLLQALAKYRITPEEQEEIKRTEQFQKNTMDFFDRIEVQFRDIADDVLYLAKAQSYKDERLRDTKRLKRLINRNKKSTIWSDIKGIDLKDPELLEYDISKMTNEDLFDYASSEYGEKGDFKGYLASVGRKMSSDDYRSPEFIKRKFTRTSEGKSSEEKVEPVEEVKSFEESITDNNKQPEKESPKKKGFLSGLPFGGLQFFSRKKPNVSNDMAQDIIVNNTQSNGNEPRAVDQIIQNMKEQTDIAKVNMAINSGGQINADKIMNKAKNGSIDEKTANKYSISGFFGNLFNNKVKADKKAARDAREASESAQAQALGDRGSDDDNKVDPKGNDSTIIAKTENNKNESIFSKIFGTIGDGITWFGNTKVGNIVKTAGKLLGAIGVIGGIGLTIAEIIKPGTADSIGAAISEWNDITKQQAEDGTLLDGIKTRVSGWFTNIGDFINTKVLSEDGLIITGAQKIAEVTPTIMENVVVPGIQNTANFIADNAETLVSAASTVITAIAPPLIESIATVIPEVVVSLGKGFWNGLWGKTGKNKGRENLTEKQKSDIEAKGGSYQSKWDDASEEEAQAAAIRGQEVQQLDDGTWQIKNDYTLDSNVYIDDNGKEQKRTNQSTVSRVGSFLSRLGINILTGRGNETAKIAKFGTNLVAKGFGGITGGILGSIIPGVGTAIGATQGAKLGGKAVKGTSNFIQSFINKLTNKGANKIAEEGTETAAKALLEATGKAAGTGIEDVAKVAAQESDTFLKKIINVIKGIPKNSAVKKIVNSVGGTKAAQVLKGLSSWCDDVVKKLLEASAEILKGTKLGKSIQKLLLEKSVKQGAKTATAAITAFLSDIAFVTIGGVAGAFDAANLFEVSKNDVDWKMRIISGLLNGLLNTSIGGWVDIALLVLQFFTGVDARKMAAAFLYKHISMDSEESEAKLNSAQDELAIETALYNQANGTNMTVSEYNDVTNKTVLGRLWDRITGKKVDTKKYSDQAKEIMQSGSYTKDKNGNITINNTTANIGNGTGSIGYGNGPIGYGITSQSDAAWANMPIGRFANGKISTMKTGGCGPTALSTIANMFGPGINPGTVGAYAARNGYISDGGANADLFTKGAAGLGLNGARVSGKSFNIALNSGAPMAISGKNSGPFTKAGHVVVAKGIDSNGKVNIIDPIDGKFKKYDKFAITSGMTNAWAYTNSVGHGTGPIGYGTNTQVVSTGLSDTSKQFITNNMGLVQNALSNVPSIIGTALTAALKNLPLALVNPMLVPIKYAVKSLGSVVKAINNDSSISYTEYMNGMNGNTLLNNMATEIKRTYRSNGISSSTSINANSIKKMTNTVSNNNNILSKVGNTIKSGWNYVSSGAKKLFGFGPGSDEVPVGYGLSLASSDILKSVSNGTLSSSIIPKSSSSTSSSSKSSNTSSSKSSVVSAILNPYQTYYDQLTSQGKVSLPRPQFITPAQNTKYNSAMAVNNNAFNTNSTPYSYTYIKDINKKYLNSIGMTSVADDYSKAIADYIWKKRTGQTPEERKAAEDRAQANQSTQSPVDTSTESSDTTSEDGGIIETAVDKIAEIRENLSKVPETFGGLVKGIKSFGSLISALFGVIKGEGTLSDILNGNSSSSTTSSSTSSGGTYSVSGGSYIGDYVKQFESGDSGPTNISSGSGDYGGASFGTYQFPTYGNSKASTGSELYKFWNRFYASKYPGVYPGNNQQFKDAWLSEAKSNTAGFQKNEWTYVYDNYYKKAKSDLANYGFDPDKKSRAIQEAIWSSAVQYGPSMTGGLGRNYRATFGTKDSNDLAPSTWLSKFYTTKRNKVSTDFKSSSTKVQNAVRNRYSKEETVLQGIANQPPVSVSSVGNGIGAIGYGPDDSNEITNWSQLMEGANKIPTYFASKLNEMGLGDLINGVDLGNSTITTSMSSGDTNGVTYDSSKWGTGSSAPVEAMKSIYGKIRYSLGSTQDPDKGVASCASTVAWAYKKALGIRPGDTVSNWAYAKSEEQAKDNRFTTIFRNTGSGLSSDMLNNLRLGDIMYYNWGRKSDNGKLGHTEMYAGNGKSLSHGGPENGPIYKDINSYRREHLMLVRRYNGFLNNSGYGEGPVGFGFDAKKTYANIGNSLQKEIRSTKIEDRNIPNLSHKEGNPISINDTSTSVMNNSDVVTRLDKILTIIGEWYMDSKNSNKSTETVTTNNTLVNNNSTVGYDTSEKKATSKITSHLDKLAQRHQTYAKMYKTTI